MIYKAEKKLYFERENFIYNKNKNIIKKICEKFKEHIYNNNY